MGDSKQHEVRLSISLQTNRRESAANCLLPEALTFGINNRSSSAICVQIVSVLVESRGGGIKEIELSAKTPLLYLWMGGISKTDHLEIISSGNDQIEDASGRRLWLQSGDAARIRFLPSLPEAVSRLQYLLSVLGSGLVRQIGPKMTGLLLSLSSRPRIPRMCGRT